MFLKTNIRLNKLVMRKERERSKFECTLYNYLKLYIFCILLSEIKMENRFAAGETKTINATQYKFQKMFSHFQYHIMQVHIGIASCGNFNVNLQLLCLFNKLAF